MNIYAKANGSNIEFYVAEERKFKKVATIDKDVVSSFVKLSEKATRKNFNLDLPVESKLEGRYFVLRLQSYDDHFDAEFMETDETLEYNYNSAYDYNSIVAETVFLAIM